MTLGLYVFEVYPQKTPFDSCHTRQVHSSRIISAQKASETTEADGLYCVGPLPRPLMVKTADCLAVAIIGEKGVALLHVGWRGLKARILQNPALGLINPVLFFLGPHICREHFEVTEEFQDHFPGSRHITRRRDKFFFSLHLEFADQINHLYPKAPVETSGLCTAEETNLHSFRRNKTSRRNENILRMLDG